MRLMSSLELFSSWHSSVAWRGGTDGGPGHFLRAEALGRVCQSAQSLGLENYSVVAIFSLHGGQRSPGCAQKPFWATLREEAACLLPCARTSPLTLSSPTQLQKSRCVDGSGRFAGRREDVPPLGTQSLPSEEVSALLPLQSFLCLGSSVTHAFHRFPPGTERETQFAKSIFSSKTRVMFLKELPTLGWLVWELTSFILELVAFSRSFLDQPWTG